LDLASIRDSLARLTASNNIRPWRREEPGEWPDLDIPSSWNTIRVGDICLHRSGIAYQSQRFTKRGIKVVRLGNISPGKHDLIRSSVFHEDEEVKRDGFVALPVYLLISQTGTRYKRDYGFFVIVPKTTNRLSVNQRILCVTVIAHVLPKFLAYYGLTNRF